ncbi:DoxX family protein [Flavobacterium sp. ASW18X]|uniref:DoxX family protein n=1 Tax=Flavobacterium sp. ASW18X TaxID=2572595 RepID=UPI0010ADFC72|nr:DoxX family protein [Flavobacterium sp. ASW18X]TKD65114.1 DoxX family protein [Flavobacterium sp. ASW18X]
MHLHFTENAASLFLSAMVVIVFLQSGIDKIIDWKGNLSWLQDHFSKTIFKNIVPFLLGTVTVVEIAAGLVSIIGFVHLLVFNHKDFAFYGAAIAGLALLMLLLGQRIAKDYDGAKTLVIHLIAVSFLLFLTA